MAADKPVEGAIGMILKRSLCIAAAAVCMFVSGCSGKNSSGDSNAQKNDLNDNGKLNFVTRSVTYEFPEFLENTDKLSLFGRLIYDSFENKGRQITADDTTPAGFNCDLAYYDGKLLRFTSGGRYGLVRPDGEVLYKADFETVEMIRPGLIVMTYKNGKRVFAQCDASGSVAEVKGDDHGWVFKNDQLSVSQVTVSSGDASPDKSEGAKYALTLPDGSSIYNMTFDSVAVFSGEKPRSDCKYAFTAHSGGYCYLILFDKYYNYQVYEGNYGSVFVSIGDRTGSCDIFSYDHYVQLSSLLNSFRYTETDVVSGKTGDHLQIVFGTDDAITAIANYYFDGYCEVTSKTDGQDRTSAYKISTEGFADTVDWLDKVLSTEFAAKE